MSFSYESVSAPLSIVTVFFFGSMEVTSCHGGLGADRERLGEKRKRTTPRRSVVPYLIFRSAGVLQVMLAGSVMRALLSLVLNYQHSDGGLALRDQAYAPINRRVGLLGQNSDGFLIPVLTIANVNTLSRRLDRRHMPHVNSQQRKTRRNLHQR